MSVAATDWGEDDAHNVSHYTGLIARFGEDVRALDWGSRQSQELRFAVLSGIGELRGTSVLDVGCGQGDLLAWLKRTGKEVDYRGVDITPAMVGVARGRFPAARFEVSDLLKDRTDQGAVDYVLCSGVFTYRRKEPVEYLKQLVTAMYRLCRRGVAFNSLSTWSPSAEEGEFHADPLQTLAFCRSLTPWVALRHDYHPRDFTVYLYRKAPPA